MPYKSTAAKAVALLTGAAAAQNSSQSTNVTDSLVRIPTEWTYLLPQPFNSTLPYSWLNSTTVGNTTIQDQLRTASQSRFVSYSNEFDCLVGNISSANVTNIQCPPGAPQCAFEAGVWIPETNDVWFTYLDFVYPYNQTFTSFNLDDRTSRQFTTDPPMTYPLGGYYIDGKTYFTDFSLPTQPATIVEIDPITKKLKPIVNSYFGIPLAPCDDVVATRVNNKDYLFFSTFSIRHVLGNAFPRQRFDTAVWRWDFAEKLLTPVISNTDIKSPNGVRVSPDGRKLYVSNTVFTDQKDFYEEADYSAQSNNIYVYDLDDTAFPVNRKLFALERTGFTNGLHIDNKGRVWTADNDGINVRAPDGRVLGLFNIQPFHNPDIPVIGNFALAGNKLVIGGLTDAVVYELNETLVTPGNLLTN